MKKLLFACAAILLYQIIPFICAPHLLCHCKMAAIVVLAAAICLSQAARRWVAASGAELALTTQKDSVKLQVESFGGRPLLALRMGMVFDRGETEFQEILDSATHTRTND